MAWGSYTTATYDTSTYWYGTTTSSYSYYTENNSRPQSPLRYKYIELDPYNVLDSDMRSCVDHIARANPRLVDIARIEVPTTAQELKEWLETLYGKIPKGVLIGLNSNGGANIRINIDNEEHVEWDEQVKGNRVYAFNSNQKMCIGEMVYSKQIAVSI
jgi:hypothetical protein